VDLAFKSLVYAQSSPSKTWLLFYQLDWQSMVDTQITRLIAGLAAFTITLNFIVKLLIEIGF
jgi:hypothetical protein